MIIIEGWRAHRCPSSMMMVVVVSKREEEEQGKLTYNDNDRRVKHFSPLVHPLRTYINATGLIFSGDDHSAEKRRKEERTINSMFNRRTGTHLRKEKEKKEEKEKAFTYCY